VENAAPPDNLADKLVERIFIGGEKWTPENSIGG
jgi:hypothetical protein